MKFATLCAASAALVASSDAASWHNHRASGHSGRSHPVFATHPGRGNAWGRGRVNVATPQLQIVQLAAPQNVRLNAPTYIPPQTGGPHQLFGQSMDDPFGFPTVQSTNGWLEYAFGGRPRNVGLAGAQNARVAAPTYTPPQTGGPHQLFGQSMDDPFGFPTVESNNGWLEYNFGERTPQTGGPYQLFEETMEDPFGFATVESNNGFLDFALGGGYEQLEVSMDAPLTTVESVNGVLEYTITP